MIFRLRDYVLHPLAIKQFHDMLLESQYWTPERRREWVQERLEQTLHQAVRHVPYYRRTLGPYEPDFNDMIDRLDLSALPMITKEVVRENYDELSADNRKLSRRMTVRTSGTTGTPTEVRIDTPSNACQFASLWRVLNWSGYRFGDRFADLRRNPKTAPITKYDPTQNCLVLSVFHLKKENVPVLVERLHRFKPVLLKGYPSAVHLLCKWIEELGLTDFRPKRVVLCAETVLDHQRAAIDDVFGCPTFDFYNHNERAGLVSTCEEGRYHIHEEYSLLEFMDAKGRHASPGGSGEVVATTLHNEVMPLIRYQTGDLVSLDSTNPCSCGRTLRTLGRISGRVSDVIVTSDGRHLSGMEHPFMEAKGILYSQIVQETTDEIEVRIVRGNTFREGEIDKVEAGLRSVLSEDMGIRFTYVDEILPGENGKIQFVISKPGREAAVGSAGGVP